MDELPPDVAALRRVRFFEDLTDHDLAAVARVGRRRTFAAGEAIVERDSEPRGLFVLLSGRARVEAGGAVHELGPGDFFGELALLGRVRRTATVTAVEPVTAMVVETTYFKPFLIANPSIAVALLEGVADRLREVQERVEREGA
ncbi:MAG TPA: Crp/Fnr family transcriptional regulator [Actinomycetota bacterium]|nr:Crp/Fnr family transcriptional regulator [Actinomycetota bacterium]